MNNNLLKQVHKWKGSFWGLADQATVSLGNFLSNWILARHIAPSEYGVFALLLGTLLFVNSLHAALISLPLGIDGAHAEVAERKRITGTGLLFSVALVPPLALVCWASCLALRRSDLLPYLVLAMTAWLLQETVRRALMASLRHRSALPGDCLSFVGQSCLLAGLQLAGKLNLKSAFVAMIITSLAAAAIQGVQTGVLLPSVDSLRERAVRFYELGRWVLSGSIVNVLNVQALPWSLAVLHGPASAASFQAVANLLTVSHPLIFGIGNLIVPASSLANARSGISAAKRIAMSYGSQGAILLIPYYTFLFIFPHFMLRRVYGAGSPYLSVTYGLRAFAVAYGFIYITQVFSSLFAGIERSKLAFIGCLSGALVALFLGFPLIMAFGTAGAMIAMLSSTTVRGIFCLYYYRMAV